MNIYRHKFYSECPNNNCIIAYDLEIKTNEVVMVEHIITYCALNKKAFHEDIADRLSTSIVGLHTMTAFHHGVEITTVRGSK
jgi:hypothetical protein